MPQFNREAALYCVCAETTFCLRAIQDFEEGSS